MDENIFKNIDFENLSQEEIDKLNDYIEGCTGNCASCGSDCHQVTPKISKYSAALVSGKGGTGRSTITALLACALSRRGLRTGIIDADITGPTIPALFGAKGIMPNDGQFITPLELSCGVHVASMGLVAEESDEPCLLGGKELGNIAAYFWTGAHWKDMDCVLIDMPAGIGDIPLNVYTVLPIDHTIVVTTPGALCARLVRKTIRLVKMLMLPVRGVVENMSMGEGDSVGLLGDERLSLLAKIAYDPEIAMAADEGRIADVICEPIEKLADSMAEEIRAMA